MASSSEANTVADRLDLTERGADHAEAAKHKQVEPGTVPVEEAKDSDGQDVAAKATHRERRYKIARHLAVLGLLIDASIWGTLAREGLIALNTYDGRSIQPVIWAQAVGCLVMGWTVANKATLEGWYPPLFIAVGTGFCGSVTTFSTWALQVFQAYSNQNHYDRHGLHNVMDALTQTAATLGMSIVSLHAGKALAEAMPAESVLQVCTPSWWRQRLSPRSFKTSKACALEAADASTTQGRSLHPERLYQLDLFCFAILGLGFWLGAALLAGLQVHPNFRPTTFAVVFGPVGTIARLYLSRLNSLPRSKSRRPYWPLGTFAANQIATLILSGLFVAQHYGSARTSPAAHTIVSCQVLYGLQEGLCGCLSTISTFAVELTTLRPRGRAVGYAIGSYIVAECICVLVIGAPWWSGGGLEGSCALLIPYRH
ncbi:unnamed protein product [Parajaminaea phylloscopi]